MNTTTTMVRGIKTHNAGSNGPSRLRRIAEHGLKLAQESESRFIDLFQHLIDEIERQKSPTTTPDKIAALGRDAARYRFLHNEWWFCGKGDVVIRRAFSPEELDRNIDSALASVQGGE